MGLVYSHTGWRVSNVSGNTNNGALGGVFYFNFNNASSNANTNISGRLCFAPVSTYLSESQCGLFLLFKFKLNLHINKPNLLVKYTQ